jgi:hypothetical protein
MQTDREPNDEIDKLAQNKHLIVQGPLRSKSFDWVLQAGVTAKKHPGRIPLPPRGPLPRYVCMGASTPTCSTTSAASFLCPFCSVPAGPVLCVVHHVPRSL